MKGDQKSHIMNEFKQGRIQVLVSTTVVEVGVDVPNATVMAVEHPERFGLSQLHQLRGRVGRGKHQSHCYLFASSRRGEISGHRLDAMEQTEDGFKLSEIDLEIRGPGEFLGTRQSGTLPFQIADLIRDQLWLTKARADAIDILKLDPELKLERHVALKGYFKRQGKQQFERLQTS